MTLLCITSNYDGFTPGERYRVIGKYPYGPRGGYPVVIDNWDEETAAGGCLGVFIEMGECDE